MFLAAVVAANARLFLSGDEHLLRVSGWRGIGVLKARPFVEYCTGSQTFNKTLLRSKTMLCLTHRISDRSPLRGRNESCRTS